MNIKMSDAVNDSLRRESYGYVMSELWKLLPNERTRVMSSSQLEGGQSLIIDS